MAKLDNLSVIVPAYNEEANLAGTLEAASSALQTRLSGQLEWLLVNDGSTDGTWAEMQRLAGQLPGAVPLMHPVRQGLGAAIWTGVRHASAEWCTWLPADGQIDPWAVAEMAHQTPQADLVILVREENKRAAGRQLLTMGMYGLIRALVGLAPYGYSGVFMVRRALIRDLPLRATSGVQNYAVVLHCYKKGVHSRQVKTTIRPRASGKSKVANPGTTLTTLYEIVRLRFT